MDFNVNHCKLISCNTLKGIHIQSNTQVNTLQLIKWVLMKILKWLHKNAEQGLVITPICTMLHFSGTVHNYVAISIQPDQESCALQQKYSFTLFFNFNSYMWTVKHLMHWWCDSLPIYFTLLFAGATIMMTMIPTQTVNPPTSGKGLLASVLQVLCNYES